MKKFTKFIIITLLFILAGCNSDDDENDLYNPPDYFDYTQEEIANEQKIIEAFINDHSLNMTKTSSGLHYSLEVERDGIKPDLTDSVIVHHEAYDITNDTLIYRSDRSASLLGQRIYIQNTIEGVKEGLLKAPEGSKLHIIVPSYLAYGKSPLSSTVPPRTILDIKFEINKVVKDSL